MASSHACHQAARPPSAHLTAGQQRGNDLSVAPQRRQPQRCAVLQGGGAQRRRPDGHVPPPLGRRRQSLQPPLAPRRRQLALAIAGRRIAPLCITLHLSLQLLLILLLLLLLPLPLLQLQKCEQGGGSSAQVSRGRSGAVAVGQRACTVATRSSWQQQGAVVQGQRQVSIGPCSHQQRNLRCLPGGSRHMQRCRQDRGNGGSQAA